METESSQHMQPTLTLPTVSELLRQSWEIFKQRWAIAIAIIFTPVVLNNLLGAVSGSVSSSILNLVIFVISIFIYGSSMALILRLVRGQTISWNDARATTTIWLNYFLGYIAVLFAIFVGIVFFILPGIYLATRLIFTLPIIADTNLGVMEAIKKSWEMTEGKWWGLFWLYFGTGALLVLATLVTLFIGLIITLPLMTISGMLLYNRMKSATV